jgi:hypothetical protein
MDILKERSDFFDGIINRAIHRSSSYACAIEDMGVEYGFFIPVLMCNFKKKNKKERK